MINRNKTSSGAHAAPKPAPTTPQVSVLFQKIALTACVALTATLATPTFAQSNVDGAIAGKAPGAGTVTVEDSATGFKRTVAASSDGSFRATALPPGVYTVTFTDGAGGTQSTQVSVVIGTTSNADFSEDTVALGEMKITASPVNPIDFAKVESVTVMTDKQLDILPVARDATSVALLAPGTVKGDTAFGNLASFGGASVAENQYYLNGFNISNFKNGLDPALIPFDAYSQFEVLTGAYSAQYGRSTGGVINATTKAGSNVWHGGVNIYYEPDSLRADSPDTFYDDGAGSRPLVYNSRDERTAFDSNIWASGPVIKDRLFVYGVYNLRDRNETNVYASTGIHEVAKSDDPFWLLKVDAIPFENHRIEYTGFQDERTWTYTNSTYDFTTGMPQDDAALAFDDRGGSTHTVRYTGMFFDRLQLSAQFGKMEQDRSSYSAEDLEVAVYDTRTGTDFWASGNPALLTVPSSLDERKAWRIDAEYAFEAAGSHRLKIGMDNEENTTEETSVYSGGIYYRYYTRAPGFTYNGGTYAQGGDVVRARVYSNDGSYEVKGNAYYLEDNWTTMDDRLMIRLGIRNETFENFNKDGGSFIKIDNQWAPRLGFTYDLFGDRKTKLAVNFGRYHLPVASNTNARLSGGEVFTEDYYVLTGVNADYTPIIGAKIGGQTVYSDGAIPDVDTIVDKDIKPMYQDEWTVSLQHQLNKSLTIGFRGVARTLATAMDDMIVDHALIAWGNRNGYGDYTEDIEGAFHYVLGNPGKGMRTAWDFDHDGVNEQVELTNEDLKYPKAERKYYSGEVFLEKVWDGKWYAQASYTLAHSYGNSEGWVLSDNGQDDAGITVMFDTPDLTVRSYGNLPNDVRHYFKAFGSYAVTSEFQVGLNAYLKSGRPVNAFVNVDDYVVGYAYGNDYFGVNRGTAGNTPWAFNFDLMLKWSPKSLPGFLSDKVSFQVDIFNILNSAKATEVYEGYEEDQGAGQLNPRYGIATSFQTPRHVRFSMAVEF